MKGRGGRLPDSRKAETHKGKRGLVRIDKAGERGQKTGFLQGDRRGGQNHSVTSAKPGV